MSVIQYCMSIIWCNPDEALLATLLLAHHCVITHSIAGATSILDFGGKDQLKNIRQSRGMKV